MTNLNSVLSEDALETVKSMVEFCVNRGYCMGMDEGIDTFGDWGNKEVKSQLRLELDAFVGAYHD
jgi:hypothetical protein